ncbi:MAG: hypothetical protein IIV44_02610 [Rikenellaceae bacterium]|jgi:hypothetical protein|nr:hypothetical protein [Rikenellaceae bacterium]
MKKTFSTLAAFCLGIVISITVVACADDINDVVTGKCDCSEKWEELKDRLSLMDNDVEGLNSKLEKFDIGKITRYMDGEYDSNAQLEYDDKGRIVKCVTKINTYPGEETTTYTFTYETGKCTVYINGVIYWVFELKDPKSENFEFIKIFISKVMDDMC